MAHHHKLKLDETWQKYLGARANGSFRGDYDVDLDLLNPEEPEQEESSEEES